MTEPTRTKTWTKYSAWIQDGDGPTPQAGQTSDRSAARLILYLIKTQMLAAGWTVVRSCGYYDAGSGLAWNYGAADHWPNAAAVRWKEASNKFGWIVLKNTNLHAGGNGFQVMFALDAGVTLTYRMTMHTSIEGGFTGGSDTAYPTATDAIVIYDDASDAWYSTTGAGQPQCPLALNIWYSSDGQSFRVWGAGQILLNQVNEVMYSLHPMMFERLVNAPPWLDKPVLAGVMRWRRVSMATPGSTASYERTLFFGCEGVVKCPVVLAAEGISNGLLINHTASQIPDMGGRWAVYPVSVISMSALVTGVVGTLADFWMVPDALASGDYFPGDGSRELAVIQNVLQGNDGTAVTIP
jgi:hypothetical protein